jgi:6-pyruvoyltetrahydropterin/6-carboxytetrahydropterin synthase
MPVTLSRTVEFRALHRLHRADWSDAENRARFGWTAAPPGHPHHYRCTVSVTGPVDERLAMVMDLAELDRILADEILARYEGRLLHEDVAGLEDVLPTCEALARDVYRRVAPRLPAGVALARVRIAEDATLHADCTGP